MDEDPWRDVSWDEPIPVRWIVVVLVVLVAGLVLFGMTDPLSPR